MSADQIFERQNNDRSGYSRRNFIQNCAVGAVALGSGSLMSFITSKGAPVKQGAAALKFSLNQNWLFGGKYTPAAMETKFNDAGFKPITIPHAVIDGLSWQDWDPAKWEDIWVYRRPFTIPERLKSFRLFLNFDGVMTNATPSVNGHELPTHQGGYLPFKYEITDLVKPGKNVLALKVDSTFSDVPPDGSPKGPKAVDYLEIGGIHRSVSLEAVPHIYVSDVFAKPVDVLKDNRKIDIKCTLDSALKGKAVKVKVELTDGAKIIAHTEKSLKIAQAGKTELDLTLNDIHNITLWHVDNPKLYHIVTTVSTEGEAIHNHTTRIGLREAIFKLDGFYLNGKKLRIFGLNRHEIYPYVGFSVPERVIRKDAEMLKHLFNCNMVRCSHYPQNDAFLDACDELGLMVWEEVPGWQYIGDDTWKEILMQNCRDMIIRDRNRPSVIIWGTRVNESPNDVELYRKTKAIAKELDDSRQTSGSMTPDSRKNWETTWHEDVFAFDDYHSEPDGSVGILKAVEGYPYFLAEAVGQYNYPARKNFNAYYRRTGELNFQQLQAIVHAQAHHKAANDPRNGGVVAWCAFEYGSLLNQFRAVKYPGVADVFRIPKLGATFYMSQGDPKRGAVIHPNFYWDFGSKSPNGPGKGVAVFSNCNELKLFVDGKAYATVKPDVANYGNLKHPPFFVDLEFTDAKPTELRIDGYLNGVRVTSRSFSASTKQDQFFVMADDKEILGDGSDASKVVFRVTDKYGAARPFATGNVSFEISGPGSIIGDNPFNLTDSGGAAAIWVKSKTKSTGIITLKATHENLGSKIVKINVKAISGDRYSI